METTVDATSVINTFTSSGNPWIGLACFLTIIVAVPMASWITKQWIAKNKELIDKERELTKKERDAQIHKLEIKENTNYLLLTQRLDELEKSINETASRFNSIYNKLDGFNGKLEEIYRSRLLYMEERAKRSTK